MKRVFDFMKTRTVMCIVSAFVIVGGIVGTVVRGGFNLGIDFQPGLNLTVEVDSREDLDIEAIRSALADYEGAQIQRLGDAADDRFVIRVRDDGSIDDFAVT
ncbi:MAG: protein translocase subunit SecF, partial [Spirochaetales bacterium]|nr:protein translocase subunit SecF [Spirochaetales bacterium]